MRILPHHRFGASLVYAALLVSISLRASAVVIYQQSADNTGALLLSSRTSDPGGSDLDTNIWDNFTLGAAQDISALSWRGGYDPMRIPEDPIVGFSINLYTSIAAGTEPNLAAGPAQTYFVGGNAGQVGAGTFGGTPLFDYSFTLPGAFHAVGGTNYWLQIQAVQTGIPDWGLARSTAGNHGHWREFSPGGVIMFGNAGGDAAFALVAPGVAQVPDSGSVEWIGALAVAGACLLHRARRILPRAC